MLEWLTTLAAAGTGLLSALAGLAGEYVWLVDNPNRYEFYALPLVVAWGAYMGWSFRQERRSRHAKEKSEEGGLDQPPSLHPLIDPARCIGCGACVSACPEGKVIGLLDGKAELVEPAACIGHGACKAACPADAITLVFGTATRGVEIPQVAPSFESNVPGIYVAGELGGMGLIANAVEQGRQAVGSISKRIAEASGRTQLPLDVVIVGGGPAGIAAGLAAREQRLRAVTLEQESFGGTVAHYPRGKITMTRAVELPLYGRVSWRKARKERLLALWADVVQQSRMPIRYGERVLRVLPVEGGAFVVQTAGTDYHTRTVLLAIGRRGSPRKLGVPGEDLAKVVYTLVAPEQYRGRRVLVVGGGDSALEAATALAVEGAIVTLSYRGAAFTRAKPQIRKRFDGVVARRGVRLLLESTVAAIHPDRCDICWAGRVMPLPNDAVVICAGGVMPSAFLRQIGIEVAVKYGTV